jgi:hypothetical protein
MSVFLTRRAVLMGTAGLLALPALPARSTTEPPRRHALLVAVSEYPNLPKSNWLRGPVNDARIMRDWLMGNPVAAVPPEAITVLGDGLEFSKAMPTLANIRSEMAALAGRVGQGDFVYLQFSGHGHQQPARDESEIDGLDEVFMPRDTEIMRKGLREWPNAYVDKDIKADIDAIRDKGAFVWAVFDCCHSATMTRNVLAGDGDEVARQIDLNSLEDFAGFDTPASRGLSAAPRQTLLGSDAVARGGLVAFYASQTIEPTFEMPLPKGSDNPVQMGLFTHTLLMRMAENPTLTYRQLGESVLQSYTAMNRMKPIPMFEGDEDALNARLFGTEAQDYLPQWPVQRADGRITIAAGEIHGLERGARLAVLSGPGDATDTALGQAEVAQIDGLRATLVPVPSAMGDLPDGAWVRMVSRPLDLVLTLALPPEGAPDRSPEESVGAITIGGLLRDIAADETMPFRLSLVPAGQRADVHLDVLSPNGVLALMQDQEGWIIPPADLAARTDAAPRLWVMNASRVLSLREGQEPVSLNLATNTVENQRVWLIDTLLRAYRATRIAALGTGNPLTQSGQVTARAYLRRGTQDLTLRAHDVPQALPMDQLWLQLANDSPGAVDVHALFVGADFSIVPAAMPERLQPGNRIDRGLFQISDTSLGREHLVVIMAEPEPMAPVLNLSFLAQSGATSRGLGGSSGLMGALYDIAEAPATRGGIVLSGPADTAKRGDVLVFSFEVSKP